MDFILKVFPIRTLRLPRRSCQPRSKCHTCFSGRHGSCRGPFNSRLEPQNSCEQCVRMCYQIPNRLPLLPARNWWLCGVHGHRRRAAWKNAEPWNRTFFPLWIACWSSRSPSLEEDLNPQSIAKEVLSLDHHPCHTYRINGAPAGLRRGRCRYPRPGDGGALSSASDGEDLACWFWPLP